jgi:hypothetical protein
MKPNNKIKMKIKIKMKNIHKIEEYTINIKH